MQRAGRLTAGVLASFAASRGITCIFLSLNDAPSLHGFCMGGKEIAYTGYGRSKLRFVAAALRAALHQPQLVVALHPNLAPLAAAMKVFAPGARSLLFTHGIEVWTPLGLVRQWALQRCDLVLAPSADTARHLMEEQGVGKSEINKLAWSLGPEFDAAESPAAPRGAPGKFPRGRIILTVGRWDAEEAYKGVDHLIMSLPALIGTVPDVQLVAIGGGSDLPRLKKMASEAGVSERVHFLPFLLAEELWEAYASCDVFALPSRGEGFGLVFLEAMAHGKPVVGGAHGGTPEIIEDGVSGYLVQHGNVAQLTERLQRLLTDEPLRYRMGAQALDRVRRDYVFDRFSGDLANLLTGLLDRRK